MKQIKNTLNWKGIATRDKLLVLTIFLLHIGIPLNIQSQVTIGSSGKPAYGALLEIKSQQAGIVANVDDNANITSTKGGLLLPRVKLNLSNLNSLEPAVEDGDSLTQEEKYKLAGLLVYNLTQEKGLLYLGIYVWNGTTWGFIIDDKVVNPITLKKDLKSLTFYETGLDPLESLVYEVNPPIAFDGTVGTISYQWYIIKNTIGGVNIDESIANATSSSYIPDTVIKTTSSSKSTLYSQNNGFYKFYCVATGSDGSTLTSSIAEVAVGCGAKTQSGKWISFMCFNLGSQKDMTIAKQMETSMPTYSFANDGLHSYNAGEENVWGSLFQWGRIADNHQMRNSFPISKSTITSSEIVNGGNCILNDQNPRPFYQVAQTSSAYGKFITTTVSPYNWNLITASSDLINLWRTSRFVPNDPCAHFNPGTASDLNGIYSEFWNDNSINPNPSSASCIDAGTGWRIPMQEEFGNILSGGTISSTQGTYNDWIWYEVESGNSNLTKTRGYQILPDGETTTLFLPAGGTRDYGTGSFYNQGYSGSYWTTNTFNNYSYSLEFNKTIINSGKVEPRSKGLSVRCVKQN